MTEQFAIVPVQHLADLIDEVRGLREDIKGATIKPAPQWLSIPDAAKALGCSKDTIRRRINSGEMQARGSSRLRKVRVDV